MRDELARARYYLGRPMDGARLLPWVRAWTASQRSGIGIADPATT
jgi:hypothetical protein